MLQKCAILGLALLLVGGLATAWVYNQTRTEQAHTPTPGIKYSLGPEEYIDKYGRWYQLSPEQQNQLVLELEQYRQDKTREQLDTEQKARLRADLDKLAAGQMDPGPLADELFGAGWQTEVEQYKKLKEQMEIVQIISVVCLSIGGMLFVVCIVFWMLRMFVGVVGRLRERSNRREEEPQPNPDLMDIEPKEPPVELPPPQERPRQGRRRLALAEPVGARSDNCPPQHPVAGEEFLSPLVAARERMACSSLTAQAAEQDAGVAVLLADEASQEMDWSPDTQWASQASPEISTITVRKETQPTARPKLQTLQSHETPSETENTLKEQAEGLQKQIAEFKEMAQSVQQATQKQSEPLSSTLKELAQQVSAIREYAACQQDRVEKLQDGYDWGIIRTFGLRVIRCIDNIESRIDNPPKDCEDLIYLEEVRDELLFAMESSGIEQFKPEIHSEYRGQEKLAEAIKDKVPADKPEQTGRIAQVIRPGYRYMMDDEEYKVVRTAQVKLFG